MMIIEKIKGIKRKENFDNITNLPLEPLITKFITYDIKPYIIMYDNNQFRSINHFESNEKIFKQWERETKTSKEGAVFPEINLQQPKDDYVEYNENW